MTTAHDNCDHCYLPLPEGEQISSTINDKEMHFCCHGCQTVCETIYGAGMGGFYQRTTEGDTLQPPPEIDSQLEVYDLDDVQREFVDELGDIREIHLLIEGIHCAACVWLIERRLADESAVLDANVNLSVRKLRIKWDNRKIKLSQIMHALGQIGYAAVPFDPEAAEGQIKKQNRHLLFRLGFAGFAAMNLMWISIALYAGADEGKFKDLFYWLGLGLATPTLLYSGYPFYRGAITGLINRHLTMDLPIAIGATITYLYSCYVVISGSEIAHVYFDTVVNFLFVILTGRYLEAMSKRMAVQSTQRLLDLQPKIATLIQDDESSIVPVSALKEEDRVLVKAGEKIPVDGIIIKGESVVDESMLTGEFVPVAKFMDDKVSAGTTNKEGVLTIRVSQTLKNTALGKIIHLVDEAQSTKAPIQCTADRIIPWFVSITLILASITFMLWVGENIEIALMAATSVLIITCPCAFGLATPMAIAVATGVGARMGVLVKHGAVLEILSTIRHFVFDKTGTLTQGKMLVSTLFFTSVSPDPEDSAINTIQKIVPSDESMEQLSESENRILDLICLLETHSEHMIAKAIVNLGQQYGLTSRAELEQIKVVSGSGIAANYHTQKQEQKIAIGTLNWIMQIAGSEKHIAEIGTQLEGMMQEYHRSGSTVVYAWLENESICAFVVEDKLRTDAVDIVKQMHQQDFKLTLLSGDKQEVADYMAEKLAIEDVIAEVMPDEKDKVIQQKQQGDLIAMVGDGINDAPALVRADVGIAMGSGTDVSIDSADVILVNGELGKIPLAAELSRATLTTIKQNITISIVYNIIMVPLAMAAMITPLVAAISMPLSSLLVIGNAARIRWRFKDK
ncbi:MAG: heavy metal translocating P-type ATPase [gamma proteobacterium symbiont of Bathyaustriella thionipta]|nr:heavy metal translocating P-type ATPase [gamma proteobacterium symbiont of Bathyaustriella thionipta]MCU7949147.1 heavy metal translocating P-type ATPase [gamma proteobacterium symbiont of Bathyaustriella thionipta]MCU7952235.1 heavy metal translocating P-type ATPase [gamma proteobacterium symbiont of Bathyaustriella thionipta]MCU7955784.1 heavy metal translocating P-type ATPase [gamma proteobacterium symbiont of Bathyaustriella thionipta]MCU7965603.1 heavy metal translocating P-type ATPase 